MNNSRAKFDQRVIDEWKVRVGHHGRGIGRLSFALFVVIIFLAVVVSFNPHAWTVSTLFVLALAWIITQQIDRNSLLCPNCNRPPVGRFSRGTSEDLDFCTYCRFWLKDPRGDNRDQ